MKIIITPSQKLILLFTIFFISVLLLSHDSHPFLSCKKDDPVAKQDSIVPWKAPSEGEIPSGNEGQQIRTGRNIFNETFKYIGPDVPDSTKRYLKTNMDCQNCHFRGGSLKDVLGLVGVYTVYPEYSSRDGKEITLQERVNSCMQRSMNGKPLPINSPEMAAIIEYLKWLSKYVPKGTKVMERGLPKIELLTRAADTTNGRLVFDRYCTTCHAGDGSGALNRPAMADVPADSLKGYDFPPIFGEHSYNNGAGMYRLLLSTSFILHKMPYSDAVLNLNEAYDVAAFINSMPRPEFPGVSKDYPDLKQKPVDFPFPPFQDQFPDIRHKYGPYQELLKEGEKSSMIQPAMN